MMRYFSICDGIGAAHVALLPLGFNCLGISEVDPNCNKLINSKYHFKNYDDFRAHKTWGHIEADLIIGGTPCQSFSTLGQRQGSKSPTGKLTLDYVDFICSNCPRYFLWENVASALSIDGGRLFQWMLNRFSQRGYGVAWRVLNSRFFGVPQNRRRVFLTGSFGNPTSAGEILFETKTMSISDTSIHKSNQEDSRAATINHWEDGRQSRMDKHSTRYRQNNSFLGTLTTQIDAGIEQITRLVIDDNRPRYLTPLECERLQGFPDNYTAGFSDTARYKMVGNSMPVPVIRWIGARILEVEQEQNVQSKAG